MQSYVTFLKYPAEKPKNFSTVDRISSDLGATSGRTILASFDGVKVEINLAAGSHSSTPCGDFTWSLRVAEWWSRRQ